MTGAVLHDYARSSAAYRVRIGLNLKGVEYDGRTVNLLEGDQKADDYRALNPQGLVPMLEIDGLKLTQSLSILVYLDQRFPEPPLVPRDIADGAHVRSLALAIACDIHPLNNLRVLKYLSGMLDVPQDKRDAWYRHWVIEGLTALEAMSAPRAGDFLFGDGVTLADICLVPQLFNARRFEVPLDEYPTLLRADANASGIEAFAAAHPDCQGTHQSTTLMGARQETRP
jgi:maleylacetoacetate isomerase